VVPLTVTLYFAVFSSTYIPQTGSLAKHLTLQNSLLSVSEYVLLNKTGRMIVAREVDWNCKYEGKHELFFELFYMMSMMLMIVLHF